MGWFKKFILNKKTNATSPEKQNENYLESCFRIEFKELPDDRDWGMIPEAIAVRDAGKRGRTDEAIRLALKMRKKMPDFDFPYNWLGKLYCDKKDTRKAREFVVEGLKQARTKALLCNRMGMIYLGEQNIIEAVKWWIKSAVLQLQFSNNLIDTWPYLIVAANALGLEQASSKFQQLSRELILSGQPAAIIRFRIGCSQEKEKIAEAIASLGSSNLWNNLYSPELKELAKNGIYCNSCNRRYKLDECINPPEICENISIIFKCPTCRIGILYTPTNGT
jgi:tetratricopeptide (TPR) repeat protein